MLPSPPQPFSLVDLLTTGARDQVCLTPEWLLGLLSAKFGPFDCDPAPYPRPAGFDGLDPGTPWGRRNYLNPPFFNLEPWVLRCELELRERGNETLLLCPMRCHMAWWHRIIAGRHAVYPIQGYVRFKGYKDELPHPLVCVWFGASAATPAALQMQEAILRPLDVARLSSGGGAGARGGSGGRLSHDRACAEHPGAFVDATGTVVLRGPVVPPEPVDRSQLAVQRTRSRGSVAAPTGTGNPPCQPPASPAEAAFSLQGGVLGGVDFVPV